MTRPTLTHWMLWIALAAILPPSAAMAQGSAQAATPGAPTPGAASSGDSPAAQQPTPGTPGAEAPQTGPEVRAQDVVEGFHEVLLDCMKRGDELGFRGRYELLYDAVEESFDLPFMARTALGSTWQELPEEEKAAFVALSRRLSAARYADNFGSDGGQSFDTLGVEKAARGTLRVETEFVQPKDRDIRFDYRMRKDKEGGWQIIDVQLDGKISELALRRGQYRSVIETDGFPRLVERLEERISELSGATVSGG